VSFARWSLGWIRRDIRGLFSPFSVDLRPQSVAACFQGWIFPRASGPTPWRRRPPSHRKSEPYPRPGSVRRLSRSRGARACRSAGPSRFPLSFGGQFVARGVQRGPFLVGFACAGADSSGGVAGACALWNHRYRCRICRWIRGRGGPTRWHRPCLQRVSLRFHPNGPHGLCSFSPERPGDGRAAWRHGLCQRSWERNRMALVE
jgi:hypothetical protein